MPDRPDHVVRPPKPPIAQDDGKTGLPVSRLPVGTRPPGADPGLKGAIITGREERGVPVPESFRRAGPGRPLLDIAKGVLVGREGLPDPLGIRGFLRQQFEGPQIAGAEPLSEDVLQKIRDVLGEDAAARAATEGLTPEVAQAVVAGIEKPPVEEPEPFAPTLETVEAGFTLGQDFPETADQAMAWKIYRPTEFRGVIPITDEFGNVTGLTMPDGTEATGEELSQFIFNKEMRRQADEIIKLHFEDLSTLAARTLDPEGIKAASDWLKGQTDISEGQSKVQAMLDSIRGDISFTIDELNAAIASANLEETNRANEKLEALRTREVKVQEDELRLTLLAIIAQNPGSLFFMKQSGMLGMFDDLGIDLSGLMAPVSTRVNITYLTALRDSSNPSDIMLYKQTIFALQAEMGVSSEAEVLRRLAVVGPGTPTAAGTTGGVRPRQVVQ